MARYRVKEPLLIEALTFEELVEYAKEHGANCMNGIPWSFSYYGLPITHENDDCYLIPSAESEKGPKRFNRGDMLIQDYFGIHPVTHDYFIEHYEPAEQPKKMDVSRAIGSVIIKHDSLKHDSLKPNTISLNDFARKVAEMTEKHLATYRELCESDAQFSFDMTMLIEPGQPTEVSQYCFRGEPVFFTIYSFEGMKFICKVLSGYWKASAELCKKIENEVL